MSMNVNGISKVTVDWQAKMACVYQKLSSKNPFESPIPMSITFDGCRVFEAILIAPHSLCENQKQPAYSMLTPFRKKLVSDGGKEVIIRSNFQRNGLLPAPKVQVIKYIKELIISPKDRCELLNNILHCRRRLMQPEIGIIMFLPCLKAVFFKIKFSNCFGINENDESFTIL